MISISRHQVSQILLALGFYSPSLLKLLKNELTFLIFTSWKSFNQTSAIWFLYSTKITLVKVTSYVKYLPSPKTRYHVTELFITFHTSFGCLVHS